MFKKSFILAILMLMGTGAVANAACTAEEAQQKATEFASAAAAYAQKDAAKYTELMQEMQKELPALQANATDLDALCKFYDSMNEKMK